MRINNLCECQNRKQTSCVGENRNFTYCFLQNWTEELKVEKRYLLCGWGADFQKQTFHNNFDIRFTLCEGKKALIM